MKSKSSSKEKGTEEKEFESKFFNYLRINTKLSSSSISEYVKILNRFVLTYGSKNVCATQEINRFIRAMREKRIYTAKYAFKYFFAMIGHQELYEKLEKLIKQIHTYDVPEIICTPITNSNADYLNWIDTQVGKDL